jgi:hypothetical protein
MTMDRFKIDEKGRVYWKGMEVIHPRIKRYLLSLMDRDHEGVWVRNQHQQVGVDMEGTPFYVEAIREGERNGEIFLWAILNDGSEEVLDPSTLRIAPDNKVYCSIKGGRFEALLTLSAYWQLVRYLVQEKDVFYFQLGSKKHPLRLEDKKEGGSL